MLVDPAVRRSILQMLSRDRRAPIASTAIAEEVGLDVELIEASLDVMQEEGLVRVQRYLGGLCEATITSRGYLEAQGPGDGGTGEGRAREAAVKGKMSVADIRSRLQEQLDKVEELIRRGASATLDEMKDWTYWTVIVIERAFGENSRQVSEFRGVSGGVWPFDGESAEAQGYRERLPEWRRLLETWVREIDEFETPSDVAEQYIRPRSQFDAYVLLKDMMQTAAGSLMVVDPYTDDETLQLLRTVSPNVHARVLTVQPAKDFDHVLKLFRQQWGGKIEARQGPKELHDRFLLIDDRVFFSGASFKDLGRRGSFMAEIRTEAIKQAVKKDIEAWWKAAQPIA